MKIPVKKTTCAALAGAVLISMTGCSELPFLNKTSDEDIVDAAEEFVKAAADCDLDKMGKVSVEDFADDSEDWEETLDFEEGEVYDDNAAKFAEAVADTIEYEIDEDSAEVKEKKASVDVVFTIADYESVLDSDEYANIDEMIDALDDADKEEIKVTVEFKKEDDEWLVSNYDDIMKDLYEFTKTQSILINEPDAEPDVYDFDYDTSTQDDIFTTSDDQSSSDDIVNSQSSDTYYDFESLMGLRYINTDDTMYAAFADADEGTWEDTVNGASFQGVFNSGVGEIRFVQYSTEDLGEIAVCVTYSPVSDADIGDTDILVTEYIEPSCDADGNIYYEVVIESPADGYYLVEIAPGVVDLCDPVISSAARVGDTCYSN